MRAKMLFLLAAALIATPSEAQSRRVVVEDSIVVDAEAWQRAEPATPTMPPGVTTCRYNLSASWLDYDTGLVNQPVSTPTLRAWHSGFFTSSLTDATLLADRWARDGFWTLPQNKVPASVVVRIKMLQSCF